LQPSKAKQRKAEQSQEQSLEQYLSRLNVEGKRAKISVKATKKARSAK